MKYLALLALFPFFALTYQPSAKGQDQAAEDISLPPWQFYQVPAPLLASTKLLATFKVSSRENLYSVRIANCGDAIQAVELKILGADVLIKSLGLQFKGGGAREFDVNRTFLAGTESGWVDLSVFRSVDPRCPTAITARAQSGGVATVQVYGNLK